MSHPEVPDLRASSLRRLATRRDAQQRTNERPDSILPLAYSKRQDETAMTRNALPISDSHQLIDKARLPDSAWTYQ